MPVQWRDMSNVQNIFGFNDAFDNSGLLVSVFRFVGINRSDVPVTKVQASVQAQLKNEPITLGFVNRNIPNKSHIVPTSDLFVEPGAEFSLAWIIPPSDERNKQGISVAEYLKTYGGFNLSIEYVADDKTYKFNREFSHAQVKELLVGKEGHWIQQHKPVPGLREYKSG
jgi:hypothetical protein